MNSDTKMRPLQSIQQMLSRFCIYPADENTNKWTKRAYILLTALVIKILIAAWISNALYFWTFVSINLEQALLALLSFAAMFGLFYTFLVSFLNRIRIKAIFDHLTDIYDASANKESFDLLVQTNRLSESIWRIYFKSVIIIMCLGIAMGPLSILFCHKSGNYNVECFVHSSGVVLPWNQQTLAGYAIEFCFVALFCGIYFVANGSFVLLFISICLHHRAFYRMFEQSVIEFNCPVTNQNRKELLCQIIRFHVSVKNWFLETANVLSPYVMVHLICNTIFTAGALYQIDLQSKNMDFNIFVSICAINTSLCNLFVYCLFGKIATESFENMADCLFETDWPDMSNELQKYLILLIANMQKSLFYHGFEVATLELETFTKFLKAVYSYYMIFKTFTAK